MENTIAQQRPSSISIRNPISVQTEYYLFIYLFIYLTETETTVAITEGT
jgi:hypothetical protein